MGVAFPARVRASRDDRCGVARVLVQMCCALRATAVAARTKSTAARLSRAQALAKLWQTTRQR